MEILKNENKSDSSTRIFAWVAQHVEKDVEKKPKVLTPKYFVTGIFGNSLKKGFVYTTAAAAWKIGFVSEECQKPFITLCWVNCSSSDVPTIDRITNISLFSLCLNVGTKYDWFMSCLMLVRPSSIFLSQPGY